MLNKISLFNKIQCDFNEQKINLDEKLNNLTNIVHHQTFSNNLARFIIFVLEYLPAYSNIIFSFECKQNKCKNTKYSSLFE